MTDADLQRHALDMAAATAKAGRRAEKTIDAKMDLAKAHAVNALTETLKATDPGRPTLRKASRSPSYKAALADLADLLDTLCGHSTAATAGMLRDAREASYRSSLSWWAGHIPAAMSVGSPTVGTTARYAFVRGLVIHGYDLRAAVGGKTLQVGKSLLSTLEQASRPGVAAKDAIDQIAGWDLRSRDTLKSAVRVAIGDAATAIDGIAAIDALKPEFRPKDDYAPPSE